MDVLYTLLLAEKSNMGRGPGRGLLQIGPDRRAGGFPRYLKRGFENELKKCIEKVVPKGPQRDPKSRPKSTERAFRRGLEKGPQKGTLSRTRKSEILLLFTTL